MTEKVLEVLGKLDEWNTRSIIWVTLEQAKLIIHLALINQMCLSVCVQYMSFGMWNTHK